MRRRVGQAFAGLVVIAAVVAVGVAATDDPDCGEDPTMAATMTHC